MILSCPNCGTQYVVKDGAIPAAGRQVRCASCKHRWHQDPGESPTPPPLEETAPAEHTASGEETIAEASLIEPRSGPEAEQLAYVEAQVDGEAGDAAPEARSEYERMEAGDSPAQYEELLMPRRQADGAQAEQFESAPPRDDGGNNEADDFSPFAASDDYAARRRRPLVTLLVIALIVAAAAAAFSFLAPPEWKARVGLGSTGASPLAFVITHRERQQLQSGNQLLTISGRIVNPTSSEQVVPPIKAQLKTRDGRVIYSWTIAPPIRRLAPGKSASFNSAEVNVPPGGDDVTITTASNG